MVRRYYLVIAACAAAVGCLSLLPVTPAQGAARPPWAAPVPASRYPLSPHRPRSVQRPPQLTGSIASCEQKLTRARRRDGQEVPALAIVGASFTAGVGPGNPRESWAFLLARRLHWDAVIYGDPGAGYVRPGAGRKGPVADEIARVDLRALAPALVIVQAGHDDIGVPAQLEQRRVTQAIALTRAEAPRARIALLTVFPGRSHRAAADRTDRAIVTAAEAADRQVIIMDPLVAGWTFGHVPSGLHPTAAGSAWIAAKVTGILREYGLLPAPARPRSAGLTICDFGIRAPASPR